MNEKTSLFYILRKKVNIDTKYRAWDNVDKFADNIHGLWPSWGARRARENITSCSLRGTDVEKKCWTVPSSKGADGRVFQADTGSCSGIPNFEAMTCKVGLWQSYLFQCSSDVVCKLRLCEWLTTWQSKVWTIIMHALLPGRNIMNILFFQWTHQLLGIAGLF